MKPLPNIKMRYESLELEDGQVIPVATPPGIVFELEVDGAGVMKRSKISHTDHDELQLSLSKKRGASDNLKERKQ